MLDTAEKSAVAQEASRESQSPLLEATDPMVTPSWGHFCRLFHLGVQTVLFEGWPAVRAYSLGRLYVVGEVICGAYDVQQNGDPFLSHACLGCKAHSLQTVATLNLCIAFKAISKIQQSPDRFR